jgi:undecaprenyl-phosphate galactose phosphotransferase/putative colanic acid biosynthesis UDP-glucose lipid carrier transferase
MSIGSGIRHQAEQTSRFPPRGTTVFSGENIPYLLSTADAFIILLSSVTAGIAYQVAMGRAVPNVLPHCAVGLLASFIYILRMSGASYYDFAESAKPRVEITDILVCWFSTGFLLAFFAFLLKIGVAYSRGAFIIFYFVAPIGLLGVRKLTKVMLGRAVARGSIRRRDILLLGDFDEIAALEPQDRLAFFGATDVRQFTLTRETDAQEGADGSAFAAVADFVRSRDCKELLLALPWSDAARIEFVRDQIKSLPVAARLLPDAHVRSLTKHASSAHQRALTIEIQRAPLSSAERSVKRAMDVLIAAAALPFFMPILGLTAIAIKLDSSGPVFFRQHRKGFNGKQFVMFKLRTMRVQEDGPVVIQATREDPRVTPFGRWLRSTSIDELPQLFNVLKGDMSLVGPRPHALAHDNQFEKVVGDYAFRHHVKPGMTGWAQCNGSRGATPSVEHVAERVRLDLWYINNWSLWLDVQIIIKTFFEVVRKRNAY